ncbi:MAG: AraC family transcriptional regulator [Lawsonibacter sp.]|nr:AraC family transcriptional regulator [Lawsonibacter sp.]
MLVRYQFNGSGIPEQPGHAVPRLSYIAKDQFSTEWNSELHTHSCAELFFILDGHGYFRTLYEEFPISVQDLLIVNANVPHTEISSMKSPLQYIVLGIVGLEAASSEEGYAMLHIYNGWTELNSCVDLMLQESSKTLPGHEDVCRCLLEVVLIQLGRQQDLSFSGESPGPRASKECEFIRRYIDNHFKEDLTLDHLAKLAHLNKYYLSHSFRREFGTSPINYLISRRVDESRFLLQKTDHPLSLIAEILGFSSLSYFSQCFRRVEGISPTEYRKQVRHQS